MWTFVLKTLIAIILVTLAVFLFAWLAGVAMVVYEGELLTLSPAGWGFLAAIILFAIGLVLLRWTFLVRED